MTSLHCLAVDPFYADAYKSSGTHFGLLTPNLDSSSLWASVLDLFYHPCCVVMTHLLSITISRAKWAENSRNKMATRYVTYYQVPAGDKTLSPILKFMVQGSISTLKPKTLNDRFRPKNDTGEPLHRSLFSCLPDVIVVVHLGRRWGH